jgi:hypothetical protein
MRAETGVRRLVDAWRADAERRRQISAGDAAADVLTYCAEQLDAALRTQDNDDEELSVADFAALHGKSVSTVRRWCQLGHITARQVGREYVIRRGEPTPRFGALAS